MHCESVLVQVRVNLHHLVYKELPFFPGFSKLDLGQMPPVGMDVKPDCSLPVFYQIRRRSLGFCHLPQGPNLGGNSGWIVSPQISYCVYVLLGRLVEQGSGRVMV